MIRREVTLVDGNEYWELISQVSHARLSGELASAWGNDQCTAPLAGAPANARDEVWQAIRHHDDGWLTWDAELHLDAQHGRPPSFLEMSVADTLPIWTASIERCAAIGPLAAWMVAGHFEQLMANSDSRHDPTARSWLHKSAQRRVAWLAQWQASNPEDQTKQVAHDALLWLQQMDALSLWVCFGKADMWPVDVPGSSISFTRARPASSEIAVSPWPFLSPSVSLTVAGTQLLARHYRTLEELTASGRPTTLTWTLVSTT